MMTTSRLLLTLLVSGLLPARASVVTLDAVRDNTIFSDTYAQLSDGQGPKTQIR